MTDAIHHPLHKQYYRKLKHTVSQVPPSFRKLKRTVSQVLPSYRKLKHTVNQVSPLRGLALLSRKDSFRKLKHTVNQVSPLRGFAPLSRRDSTLLTVGEAQRNLRTGQPFTLPQSRRDDTCYSETSRFAPLVSRILYLVPLFIIAIALHGTAVAQIPDNISRWIDSELANARRTTMMDFEAGEFFVQEDTARLVGYIRGYDPQAGISSGIIFTGNLITNENSPAAIRIHEDGRFESDILMTHPACLTADVGDAKIEFYIQPGQTLVMLLNWEDFLAARQSGNSIYRFRSIQFRGVAADLNNELKLFNDLLPEFDYWGIINEEMDKSPDEFKACVESWMADYFGAYRRLLETRELSKNAGAILENNYKIRNAMYPLEYELNYRDDLLPLTFYDFLKDIPMNDKRLFSVPDFWIFLNRLAYCKPLEEARLLVTKAVFPEKTFVEYLFEELGVPKTPEDEAYILMKDSIHFKLYHTADMTDEMRQKFLDEADDAEKKLIARHGEDRLKEYEAKYEAALKGLTWGEINIEEWRIRDSLYTHVLKLKPGIVYDATKVQSLDGFFNYGAYIQKEAAWQVLTSITAGITEPFLLKEAERIFHKNFPEGQPEVYSLPDTYEASIFKEIIAPFKGKVLLVDFWATSCGPCVYNIESHKKLRDRYKDSPDVAFLFITSEHESPQKYYDQFVAEQELEHTFRLSVDKSHYLRQLFRFNGIPRYVLVDRDGNILNDNLPVNRHAEQLERAAKISD
jgi:thiol-disulfide isomerase/thioredoxin